MGSTAVAVYNALSNTVSKLMNKSDKLNTVDRADIKKFIDILIADHQNTINSTSILTTSDLKSFKERLLLTVNKSKNPAASVYTEYNKGIIKTSRIWEDKRYLGAMTNAQIEMVRILTDISKQINTLIEKDEIDLFDCRMSQVAILGIIEQASLLASFSNYFWNLLCSMVDGTDDMIAGYRNDYLLKNCNNALLVINMLNNQNGKYNFLQDVMLARQKQHDMVLSTDGTLFSKFNSPDNNTQMMNSFIGSGAIGFVLNIFAWANQLLDDFLYTRHLKNKETKAWVEVRIAKLKLDLQDMNPNDVQYQRLTKIIEGYDEKLCDIDRKLDKYVTSAMESLDTDITSDTQLVEGNELFGIGKRKLYTCSTANISKFNDGYPLNKPHNQFDKINAMKELDTSKLLFSSKNECVEHLVCSLCRLNLDFSKTKVITVAKSVFTKLQQPIYLNILEINKDDVTTVKHGNSDQHSLLVLTKDISKFESIKTTCIDLCKELKINVVVEDPQLKQTKQQAISFAIDTISQKLSSEEADIKRGFSKVTIDNNDKEHFLNSTKKYISLYQYDLNKMSSNAREDSSDLNSKISKFVKSIDAIVTDKFRDFSVDIDGDWDTGFVQLYYTNKVD